MPVCRLLCLTMHQFIRNKYLSSGTPSIVGPISRRLTSQEGGTIVNQI